MLWNTCWRIYAIHAIQAIQLFSSVNKLEQKLHFIWKTLFSAQYEDACYSQLNDWKDSSIAEDICLHK